jgi:hypothetical protein
MFGIIWIKGRLPPSLPPISKKSASKFSDLASNKFMKGNVNKGWSVTRWPIYIKKYFKAKEELWKLKYFSMQKCNLQKILCK